MKPNRESLAICALAAALLVQSAAAGDLPVGPDAGGGDLSVERSIVDFGAFSTRDPLESTPAKQPVRVRVSSSRSWRLEAQLTGAPRRAGDGRELPLSRARTILPWIPPEVVNLNPFTIATGEGRKEAQEVEFGLEPVERAVQACLQKTDAPGIYRTGLILRLVDDTGATPGRPVRLDLELQLIRWVAFVGEPPVFEIALEDGGSSGRSEVAAVRIDANAPWRLTIYPAGGSGSGPAAEDVSVCVPDAGRKNWNVSGGCSRLARETFIIEGEPVLEGATEIEIPLYVTVETRPEPPVGRSCIPLALACEVRL